MVSIVSCIALIASSALDLRNLLSWFNSQSLSLQSYKVHKVGWHGTAIGHQSSGFDMSNTEFKHEGISQKVISKQKFMNWKIVRRESYRIWLLFSIHLNKFFSWTEPFEQLLFLYNVGSTDKILPIKFLYPCFIHFIGLSL